MATTVIALNEVSKDINNQTRVTLVDWTLLEWSLVCTWAQPTMKCLVQILLMRLHINLSANALAEYNKEWSSRKPQENTAIKIERALIRATSVENNLYKHCSQVWSFDTAAITHKDSTKWCLHENSVAQKHVTHSNKLFAWQLNRREMAGSANCWDIKCQWIAINDAAHDSTKRMLCVIKVREKEQVCRGKNNLRREKWIQQNQVNRHIKLKASNADKHGFCESHTRNSDSNWLN